MGSVFRRGQIFLGWAEGGHFFMASKGKVTRFFHQVKGVYSYFQRWKQNFFRQILNACGLVVLLGEQVEGVIEYLHK